MNRLLESMNGIATKKAVSGAEAHEEDLVTAVWGVTGFVLLLTGILLAAPQIERQKYLNESATTVILGFMAGSIILILFPGSHIKLQFSETLFFVAFLPPVIFAAGFNAPKRSFFQNIIPILLFGVIGTITSTIVIAFGIRVMFPKLGLSTLRTSDCLLMGCIFSATDSVATLSILDKKKQPRLYALVFGEGVLNDATSIVLVRALLSLRKSIDIESSKSSGVTINVLDTADYFALVRNFLWLSFTSLLTGLVFGLLSAYVIRQQRKTRIESHQLYLSRSRAIVSNAEYEVETHSAQKELALLALLGYLSYLATESMQLSGILAVFATGLVMSTYTAMHLSTDARLAAHVLFSAISAVAEHAVLLYVGVDSLDIQKWGKLNFIEGFVVFFSLVVLVAFARATFVFPLTSLTNMFSKRNRIPWKEAVAVWWSGLVRGAVSIALAYHVFSSNSGKSFSKRNASIIAVTLAVVLFTTVVLGCLTKIVMSLLFVSNNYSVLHTEDVATLTKWERYWYSFESTYVTPYFGNIKESEDQLERLE